MNAIEERREHVIGRREDGWTWVRIAMEFGVSSSQAARLYKLGLQDREKRRAAAAQTAATPDTPVRDLGVGPALTFALIHIGCTDLASVLTRDLGTLRSTLRQYPNVGSRALMPFESLLARFAE